MGLRAARSLKEQPAEVDKTGPRQDGAQEHCSRVLQWVFVLCGDSRQGSRALRSYNPANLLPSSLIGQARWPPGGSTAQINLPKSSTDHSPAQPANSASCPPQLRLAENTNRRLRKQAHLRCGSLWKAVKQGSLFRDQGSVLEALMFPG